jgi:hypothetical protein
MNRSASAGFVRFVIAVARYPHVLMMVIIPLSKAASSALALASSDTSSSTDRPCLVALAKALRCRIGVSNNVRCGNSASAAAAFSTA